MSKCRSVKAFFIVATVGLITNLSLAQFTNEGPIGSGNMIVPIDMDDPYSYDKNFVANLVGDLHGEQFSFTNSMLWLGEHVDSDPLLPRILGLTNQIPVHNAEELGVDNGVTYSEIARHSASWLGYSSSTGVSTVSGIPFSYEIEEYGDIVAGWLDNSAGVSRLVVGAVLVLHYEVTNPMGEQADLYFERFYPIQMFFSEGQADTYAFDMANETSFAGVMTGESDCASLPAGNERALCFCLNTIEINYDQDKLNCFAEPDIGDAIKVGVAAGAGAAVSGGIVKRIAKKASGLWGTVTLGVGGFIIGSGTMYGAEFAQCRIRAKSGRDADVNHANNAFNQAEADGATFSCPTGAH